MSFANTSFLGRHFPSPQTQFSFTLDPLESRTLLTLVGNSLFPADNPWNHPIASAPVAANSGVLVTSIGAARALHPDFGTTFGGGAIGIPFNIVPGTQPKISVTIDAYPAESDITPVPIPDGAVIEGDPLPSSQNTSDRHLIVYDKDNNVAYELFNVHRPADEADGQWHADSEAVWQMSVDWFRTAGYTSADAAGLPILPGLVRPDEVLDQGVINHALRFTVQSSRNAYVFPASHSAGVNNTSLARMGERFRLKQSFDISHFSAPDQVILLALKNYGMIVADNGSNWFLSGQPSSRWDDNDLHNLTQVLGSNLEAVDLTPIVTGLDQTTGPGGTDVTVHGQNFTGNASQLTVFFGSAGAGNIRIQSDTTLIVTAPSHAVGTIDVKIKTPYGTSAISAADHFTYTAAPAAVVKRAVFYNNSSFDGNSAAANATLDNAAIAPDKTALLAGQTASYSNYTNYLAGLNGVIVDLTNLPVGSSALSATDFTFLAGNSSTPSTWAAPSVLPSVTVFRSAGINGSDRVELIWPDGTLRDQWLKITVNPTAATGLPAADVFYFGNLVGDTGNNPPGATQANVTIGDILATKNQNGQPADLTSSYDFNRSGGVTIGDILIVKNYNTAFLPLLTAPTPPVAKASSAATPLSWVVPVTSLFPSWLTILPHRPKHDLLRDL